MALEQCKAQFKWERWNCPELAFATRYDNPVTKEMAYVSAVTSAGIAHAVTRGCSKGSISACGCIKDSPPLDLVANNQSKWEWGGCSDDVAVGSTVARTFLRSLEGANADMISNLNLHNAKLGLNLVRESIQPECKCHGVSGSCTTRTCWRRVEPFAKIGEKLKHRFARALRIQVNSPKHATNLPDSLLAFVEDSPDYCKANATTGWPGTGGRECSRGGDKGEKRSCKELCRACGHQVRRRHVKESWHCNCTFRWCCKVECSTCHRTVVQRYCDDAPHRY
ncbi:Hypothetical protein NTJ_04755 [Nesidiocoris tenuis]|uniref:Protein Wnt n=1 Tax=Nesidiocoris tenuis TaxID=355587 RepID=A0ABN7AI54_9HEMI|nr:Hypothetical protein NTJ_04755 [Nesidiocoris tenuis]